jgi:hypothetical protein
MKCAKVRTAQLMDEIFGVFIIGNMNVTIINLPERLILVEDGFRVLKTTVGGLSSEIVIDRG